MGIVACVEKTTTTTTTPAPETTTAGKSAAPTTTAPPSTTGTIALKESTTQEQSTTTTTLPPTTSSMKYCEETNGMNQPVDIKPGQVSSNPSPSNPSPAGDINPTTTKPGLNFPSDKPQINITLNEPQEINTIYVPTNRPNESTNVEEFTVQFLFPNGTLSPVFSAIPSVIPSTSGTTTPSTGAGSESTTTPSTVNGVVPPSDSSPQVQLPENYDVPKDTIIILTVKKTMDNSPARGVCVFVLYLVSVGIMEREAMQTEVECTERMNKCPREESF